MSAKPREGWTEMQWAEFKKEADASFDNWLDNHSGLAHNCSFNECKRMWLQENIKR